MTFSTHVTNSVAFTASTLSASQADLKLNAFSLWKVLLQWPAEASLKYTQACQLIQVLNGKWT